MADFFRHDLTLAVVLVVTTLFGARALQGEPAAAGAAPRPALDAAVVALPRALPDGGLHDEAPPSLARSVAEEGSTAAVEGAPAAAAGPASEPAVALSGLEAAPARAPERPRVQMDRSAANALLPTRLPAPTDPPTPTRVPTVTPTPKPWAVARVPAPGDWQSQLRPARDRRNAASLFDPAALPATMIGVNFTGPSLQAADLFPTPDTPMVNAPPPPMSAWDVELVYTSDPRFDEQLAAELVDKSERGFRVLLRVDYERKQPVPPADDPAAVQRYVDTFLRYYEMTEGRVRFFILGNEGNVDAPGDDPRRTTECLAGRFACSPENYVRVYRQVRWALRSSTDAYVLVGAVSPGTTHDPARYVDGATYLRSILELLHPLEVDGIALHAYGGQDVVTAGSPDALGTFIAQVSEQVDAVTEASFLTTPLFLTEINQYTVPDPAFVEGAYAWIDEHNRRSAQDILAVCWFTYHDETGEWRAMALEDQPATLAALAAAAALPPGR